jgi:hypothetical protein
MDQPVGLVIKVGTYNIISNNVAAVITVNRRAPYLQILIFDHGLITMDGIIIPLQLA